MQSRDINDISHNNVKLFRKSGNYPKNHYIKGLTCLLLLLVAVSAPAREGQSPHHFDLACNSCHLTGGEDSQAGEVFRDVIDGCTQGGCHTKPSNTDHPMARAVSRETPDDLPLDDYNSINCITCHDIAGNQALSEKHPYLLRKASQKELCASCHQNSGRTSKQMSHWQFTTQAHLKLKSNASSISLNSARSPVMQTIDYESRNCISCHDNMYSAISGDNSISRYNKWKMSSMSNHLIGTDYQAMAGKPGSQLQPTMFLNPDIRLIDGKLGCGSCHNLYNDSPNHLSVNNRGSALCLNCHNK